ncbi:AAR2 protein-domain-containing protein [Dactylonectria macrodidyma]|uniref:AAR2 protein-domain-containing protein n=1 Tax=Dactylonectria macrodidyma TaxID=307937 RepID=A0A9P9ENI7_9HYPO|nr:AAR2 protein-domain-containing protein [Dactylonectria macrodidyma]
MDINAPLPHRIPKLTKSISSASAGDASVKSVHVLGTHPLGTLHVHEPADLMMEEEQDDDGPPPLDPPARQDAHQRFNPSQTSLEKPRVTSPREPLRHGMGGGDVVLILDLPELFTVGYDSLSFTAKHFGGVRDIPPGPHFFWFAHPGGLSARTGFWVVSTGVDTVHVMQWDKFNEIIGESARAEARIQAENLDTFHSNLVPYSDPSAVNVLHGNLLPSASERNHKIWQQLTGNISDGLLSRIIGQRYDNWTVHTGDRVNGSILMAAEMELDKAISKYLTKTRELNFAFNQQSKTYSIGNTGADRTLDATDATPYMTSLIDNTDSGLTADDIVGDFQFAFVAGMHLGNDSCIQQWWHMLLNLALRAYLLPARRPVLAAALLRSLAAQLSYSNSWLDGSVLDYAESHTKDLRLSLTIYKRRLDELLLGLGKQASSDQLSVGTAFAGLEATVISELGWDLRGEYLRRGNVMMEDGEQVELEVTDFEAEDERGEFAPEVVQLDESGRQRDLVSWND